MIVIRRAEGTAIADAVTKAFAKLADYELTGLTPKEICRLYSLAKNAGLMDLLYMKDERPLTLKELQILYGKAVWTCNPDNRFNGEYGCVCKRPVSTYESERFYIFTSSSHKMLEFAEYNKSWIAYCRKPEERTT